MTKHDPATRTDRPGGRSRRSVTPTSFIERQRRIRVSYDSEAMQARRNAILRATRSIVDAGGIDAVSLRKVAKDADVSVQTIYKAFGDRTGLIAAVFEDDFLEKLHAFDNHGEGIEGIFQYIEKSSVILPGDIEQTRVLVRNYFSDTPDSRIHTTLRNFAAVTTAPWLISLRANGDLADWADDEMIISKISSARFNVVLDWIAGRTPQERLADELKLATLLILASTTVGERRNEICAHLEAISRRLHLPQS
jgi:AcrR family transcriptional regulator